jgi:glycerophosphoryl diester phosphodiesterase
MRFRFRARVALPLLLATAAALYLLNASWLAAEPSGRPILLAHRGVHQTYRPDGITKQSCTATAIDAPRHDYIENTLPSMRAAFDAGADIVEFDVHPTRDGHFAVFHDWTLECRTEGRGVTREQTLADLKTLDVGYGYTADGGKTFPLRGKGVGLMPSLDQVLTAFPGKGFLINVKSNDPAEGELLAERLLKLTPQQRDTLAVYGGEKPMAVLRRRLPEMKTMSKEQEIACLGRYLAIGWAGYVPSSCANNLLLIPSNYTWLIWGWPDRFLQRMHGVSAAVVLAGRIEGNDISTGLDTVEALKAAPQHPRLGIWTNRIESIAPAP